MNGGPSASERAARTREDERRVGAVAARWIADIDLVASRLAAAEAAPSPLPEEECRGVGEANERLRLMDRGLEAWFLHAPDIAPVGEGYAGADETLAKAIRAPFLARVRAILPTDADARIRALRPRVERMTRRAREAEEAREEAREAEDRRQEEARERARPALMREEAEKDCKSACLSRAVRCNEHCAGLTPSSCIMCSVDQDACVIRCKKGGDGGR